MPMVQQYEYRVEKDVVVRNKLNELGARGWEMVEGMGNGYYIFRREAGASIMCQPCFEEECGECNDVLDHPTQRRGVAQCRCPSCGNES